MRWRLRLEEYVFSIYHKKGLLNRKADSLARLTSDESVQVTQKFDILSYCINLVRHEVDDEQSSKFLMTKLLKEKTEDSFCKNVLKELKVTPKLQF